MSDERIKAPHLLNEQEKDNRVHELFGLYKKRQLSYAEWLAVTAIYEEDEDG